MKCIAEKLGIEAVDRRHSMLNIKFHEKTNVDAQKLMDLVARTKGAQFTPLGVLRIPIDGNAPPAAMLDYIDHQIVSALA